MMFLSFAGIFCLLPVWLLQADQAPAPLAPESAETKEPEPYPIPEPIDLSQVPTNAMTSTQVLDLVLQGWGLTDPKSNPELVDQLTKLWANPDAPILETLQKTAVLREPATVNILSLQSPAAKPHLVWDQLQALKLPPFMETNLAVLLADELIQREFVEEGYQILNTIDQKLLADPARYLFLRAVSCYRLQYKLDTLTALERLEQIKALPQRYVLTMQQLRAVVEPLEREKLAGIAHDMRDVRRRLDLGRTHDKVQHLEKDVIARLDKLIEDLEKQMQQQQSSSADSQMSPANPADESLPLQAKGPGEVDEKKFRDKNAWGNLPLKEREKAMQSLGREFPPHYRTATEDYFRKLAELKEAE